MSYALSLLASVAAGIATSLVAGAVRFAMESARARRQTEVAKFHAALESDSLEEFGSYLSSTLGDVNIDAYLNNNTARDRIDRYLERISTFLSAPDEAPTAEGPAVPPISIDLSARAGDVPAVQLALKRLAAGQTWDALALLRRDLEQLLQRKSEPISGSPSSPRNMTAFRLLAPSAQQTFMHFWNIASSAIHGSEVTIELASAAVSDARTLYSALQALPDNETPPSTFKLGERIFHQKFGYGHVRFIEGRKLTVEFEKVGEKRVLDSFVVPASAA